MYNEFNKHKKSDSVKWVIVFVAIILLATSVVAIVTKGFTQADPFGWFSQPEIENVPEDVTNQEESGEEQELLYTVENSSMMYLSAKRISDPVASYANNFSIELRATVKPANAVAGVYMWSIEWEDPFTGFAMGEDAYDYIDLQEADEGVVYVRALQAFASPIIVTVQSSLNPDAKATCKLDYGQKTIDYQTLEGYGPFFLESTMEAGNRYGGLQIQPMTADELYDSYFLSGSIVFSLNMTPVYTVPNSNVHYEYQVTITDEFFNALEMAGIMDSAGPETMIFDTNTNTVTIADLLNGIGCGKLLPTSSGESVDAAKLNALNQVLFKLDGADIFTISVVVYDTWGTTNYDFTIYANAAELIQFPESMEMNRANIIL